MTLRLLYGLAVLAVACAATWAASLLPVTDPTTAAGLCITAGSVAGLLTTTYLPCPCHRKDQS